MMAMWEICWVKISDIFGGRNLGMIRQIPRSKLEEMCLHQRSFVVVPECTDVGYLVIIMSFYRCSTETIIFSSIISTTSNSNPVHSTLLILASILISFFQQTQSRPSSLILRHQSFPYIRYTINSDICARSCLGDG